MCVLEERCYYTRDLLTILNLPSVPEKLDFFIKMINSERVNVDIKAVIISVQI